MRMLALHMNDTLIFGGLEFRQMRVYRCCSSRVRVHVEKRSIEHRQKKRRYCAAGRQFSHGRIVLIHHFEVNETNGNKLPSSAE